MGQKKLIGDEFKVIPLANLQELRLTKETSLDILEISSLEGVTKIVLTEDEAPYVLATLKQTVQEIITKKEPETHLSKAEQLLKMKELMDQGILTAKEFEKIKEEIFQ
jgi:tyrosine-protein phosphatase YwqE